MVRRDAGRRAAQPVRAGPGAGPGRGRVERGGRGPARATPTCCYAAAVRDVDDGVRDGTLLRGEVLARWQEFVGTGELLRGLQSRVGRLRDRVASAVTGRPLPDQELADAVESSVESLVRRGGGPGGGADRGGLAGPARRRGPARRVPDGLARSSEDFAERLRTEVRDWQGDVLDLVRPRGRPAPYDGPDGVVRRERCRPRGHARRLRPDRRAPPGPRCVVAGGTSAVSQKVLEAVFGDQAGPGHWPTQARHDLMERVDAAAGRRGGAVPHARARRRAGPGRGRGAAGRGARAGAGPAGLGGGQPAGRAAAPARAARRPGRGAEAVLVATCLRVAPRSPTGWRRSARSSSSPTGGSTRRWSTRPPGSPARPARGCGCRRRAHRGRARRSHRQRQVVAVQRAGRGARSARSGVRRPTTGGGDTRWSGAPTGAGPLLDWLEVPRRHAAGPTAGRTRPTGWCCSTCRTSTRSEVAAPAGGRPAGRLVDLLVWVLDPQKYADAAVHDRYLRPLAGHGDVTVVVLNQADRLDPAGRGGVPGRPAPAAGRRRAARRAGAGRVGADRRRGSTRCAKELADAVAAPGARRCSGSRPTSTGDRGGAAAGRARPAPVPGCAGTDRDALVDALTDAAGAGPTIAAAVDRAHRARAAAVTGWPFTRWLRRLRPDPMRRLRLPETPSEADSDRAAGAVRGAAGAGGQRAARADRAGDRGACPSRGRGSSGRRPPARPRTCPTCWTVRSPAPTWAPPAGRGGSCRSGSCRRCWRWRRWPGWSGCWCCSRWTG